MNLLQAALDDALTSIELDSDWYKVIYSLLFYTFDWLRFNLFVDQQRA